LKARGLGLEGRQRLGLLVVALVVLGLVLVLRPVLVLPPVLVPDAVGRREDPAAPDEGPPTVHLPVLHQSDLPLDLSLRNSTV